MAMSIPLTRGQSALIDDADMELVSGFKWRAAWCESAKTYYAVTSGKLINGRQSFIYMHRLIMGISDGAVHVDHRNHCGIDNQRSNLRRCTRGQNGANRQSRIGQSRFKGVSWDAREGKWRARIWVNNKLYSLGYHKSEDEAATAYNIAAKKMCGEFCFLNVLEIIDECDHESPAIGAGNTSRQSAMAE